MALVLKDRVKETSSSSGTGSITLTGAFAGYQTFNTAIASGSTVYYTIHNLVPGSDTEWEVGVGTFTAPATLSRDTVLSSSAGAPTKTNFTSGTEGLEVFVTQPAEEAVYINQATGKVEVFGNGTNVVTFTEINTTNLTANTVTLTAGTISTNAANATDIVNKQYVDGIVAAGVHYHAPVLVESPTALNATYNQPGGAGNGVGATLTNNGANAVLVIDGVTLSNTARVLVYTQSNAVQNGIYTVTNEGAPDSPGPGAKWVLTRATDADTYVIDSPTGLSEGSTFFVQSGNTGAGETYTCNTTGTITFGTTNITFAQISSAQIYSAGTGLNLNNTTFSIANTTVTAAVYGNDGNVAQITVNAQGQLTNAANVAINASSITVGTLANARTTASDANGASTIVARDSTGSFTANTITATTSNATTFNGTTGAFTNVSGNGAAISAINASNISSGTIDNTRTTGSTSNSASTLVLRDSNGSFGANIVSASFSGDGSAISAINASNISSGTIANARTTASSSNGASTIVLRDAGGNFSANTITANISGDISGGTNINASNITSGTIANARTTASSSNGASTIVLRDAGGAFAAGAITGTSFSGNGAAITAINASAITTGTLDNARTSASSANGASTIVARDAGGNFSANTITATTFSGALSGNGSAISAINASNISTGTIANARTTASDANGASTIVSRDANGSFTANVITATTFSGGGGSISAINASNISTGTIANARTTAATANGASTIVLRGASGEFSAGIITADGSGLSAINGSNVTTGTVANARTTAASANGASTIVARDANGSFAGNVITATTFSGSGASLTNIPNSATTANSANGASTIVARDANGSFTANVGTFTTVSGAGGGLTGINASNISTGTIANARTTASDANGASTIVARDASGNFTANAVTLTTGFFGNGSNTAPSIAFTNSTGTGLFLAAANTIAFTEGGVEAMRINSSGNVGIGTSSPSVRLDVQGGRSSFTANSENFSVYLRYNNSTSGFYIGSPSADAMAFSASSGAERMRIDASGNVGIGTTAPAGKVGIQSATGAAVKQIVLGSEPTNTNDYQAITFQYSQTDGGIQSEIRSLRNSAGAFGSILAFCTEGTGGAGATERLRIAAAGQIGIGGANYGTAGQVLTSNGSASAPSWQAAAGFPAGTVMLFAQTAAPTGWTKNTTTGDNSALRVVTGTASTGGSVAFTTAFASQTPTGSVSITAVSGTAGNTTLTTPLIPSHNHTGKVGNGPAGHPGGGAPNISGPAVDMGNTGGGGAHSHPFSFTSGSGTFSGNAINLAVQYIDVIRATKD